MIQKDVCLCHMCLALFVTWMGLHFLHLFFTSITNSCSCWLHNPLLTGDADDVQICIMCQVLLQSFVSSCKEAVALHCAKNHSKCLIWHETLQGKMELQQQNMTFLLTLPTSVCHCVSWKIGGLRNNKKQTAKKNCISVLVQGSLLLWQ